MEPRRLLLAFLAAGLVTLGGVAGYVLIEGWDVFDALYMTIISITTVGYGETRPLTPAGRIFTMLLLLVGVGLIFFIFTRLNEGLIEGKLRRVMGRRRMDKTIGRLKDHYIICGYGRLGRKLDAILSSRGVETVVIERSPEITALLDERGRRYILGQATSDEVLLRAGIKQAGGLVAGVNADADNVYITLSARELRPDLFIIARCSDPEAAAKLHRAGASKVVSPVENEARRIAQTILNPTITDFLDLTLADDRHVPVLMEELLVGGNSPLTGLALKDSGLRADLNLIVVAIKRPDGSMHFNPGPQDVIESGATLVAIGPSDRLDRLARLLDAPSRSGSNRANHSKN